MEDQEVEWKNIKKKNMKCVMLENYILEQKKKYDWTFNEARDVCEKINHAISMKRISANNIKTVNNNIVNIEGVDFDKGGKCYITPYKSSNFSTKNKDTTIAMETFNQRWINYKLGKIGQI